ncbi:MULTISPECIES: hypothetical protein [Actinomycetes]|uniref:hypothetical protein n=1 Tax=Actinomycetes TaxID=1760 RepID=UPI0031F9E71B
MIISDSTVSATSIAVGGISFLLLGKLWIGVAQYWHGMNSAMTVQTGEAQEGATCSYVLQSPAIEMTSRMSLLENSVIGSGKRP